MIGQLFTGFVGGIIGSIATAFVGQPIYSFMALRSGTASAMARYERVDTLLAMADTKWLADRRIAYENCGAALVSLAVTNEILTKILKKYGFDLQSAGDDLLILSQIAHGHAEASIVQERVATALRLNLYPL